MQFIDDIKPLSENDLYRVRGVPGVEWAVRLYKGIARARLADGNFQQIILLGLDDATLVGAPREMIARRAGRSAAARRADHGRRRLQAALAGTSRSSSARRSR